MTKANFALPNKRHSTSFRLAIGIMFSGVNETSTAIRLRELQANVPLQLSHCPPHYCLIMTPVFLSAMCHRHLPPATRYPHCLRSLIAICQPNLLRQRER